MIVDLNVYSINKSFVQEWWHIRGKDDPKSAISIMANATMAPAIVVAYYIGETAGWPDYIKRSVDVIMKFYGYTEIIGKPEGCPW